MRFILFGSFLILTMGCAYFDTVRSYTVKTRHASGAEPDTALAVAAANVRLLRASELPPGLDRVVAKDYPTAEQPHRDLGRLELVEQVRFHVEREFWETQPEIVAQREAWLRKEAATRGANTVVADGSTIIDENPPYGFVAPPGYIQFGRQSSYRLLWVSAAVPTFPEVAEIFKSLKADADEFREIRRFTVKLADLPKRVEQLQLKSGHAYRVALVLHPEVAKLDLPTKATLEYRLDVKADQRIYQGKEAPPREGHFTQGFDRQYKGHEGIGWRFQRREVVPNGVDGVYARGGFGDLSDFERRSPLSVGNVEFVPSTAKLRFVLVDAAAKESELPVLGSGAVDVVVLEKPLPEKLASESCLRCRETAQKCNVRRSLAECKALQTCLKRYERSVAFCEKDYEEL